MTDDHLHHEQQWQATMTTHWVHQLPTVGVDKHIIIFPRTWANHYTQSASWVSVAFPEAMGMNKSASLTPVQGPPTVVCMIVTELSQLPDWLHQLPTVGKGRWQAPSCELSFCCNSGSNGKTQPYYWLATDPTRKTRQRNKERQKGKRTGKD